MHKLIAGWPSRFPRSLPRPQTTLHYNLDVCAARYPERLAIGFFGCDINYRSFHGQVLSLAGWLQSRAGVKRGDRVAIFGQNSPQWLIAYYAILRCDAVVVPINPMNRVVELRRILQDSGSRVAICAQELAETLMESSSATDLSTIVVATYSDYLPEVAQFELPEWLTAGRASMSGCVAWQDTLGHAQRPGVSLSQSDDFCLLPYTSGSTGAAKGCVHTHQTFMQVTAGMSIWHRQNAATVFLGAPPMYQVSGLANSVNCPVFSGGMVIPLPRWDRKLAVQLIAKYRINHVALAPTAIIDLLGYPELLAYDLKSISRLTSGGAAMPKPIWKQAQDVLGVPFIEAYGLTETAATTHINSSMRPKPQCLGLPFFDTQSMVVDPVTFLPVEPGCHGEIIVRGPQVFSGYWNNPQETQRAFLEVDGESYFRTGDIGFADDEGYYFMVDRQKRMINASGYKVWPAEVENLLYEHPDVMEACVVGVPDSYRGETVKAIIVLQSARRHTLTEGHIIQWARERMAAYKYPRVVEFVDVLPKSPTGKILWRELQTRENNRKTQSAANTNEDAR